MLELALKWLLAYLLGSLMGALLIGRLKGVDIREQGSGNAGGTNALRTQGKAFAPSAAALISSSSTERGAGAKLWAFAAARRMSAVACAAARGSALVRSARARSSGVRVCMGLLW